MARERRVKLFKRGRNQAAPIPREFALAEDAAMRRDGDRMIIEPGPSKSLLAVLAGLSPIDGIFHRALNFDVLRRPYEHCL
jgi:antitoxin VapB